MGKPNPDLSFTCLISSLSIAAKKNTTDIFQGNEKWRTARENQLLICTRLSCLRNDCKMQCIKKFFWLTSFWHGFRPANQVSLMDRLFR